MDNYIDSFPLPGKSFVTSYYLQLLKSLAVLITMIVISCHKINQSFSRLATCVKTSQQHDFSFIVTDVYRQFKQRGQHFPTIHVYTHQILTYIYMCKPVVCMCRLIARVWITVCSTQLHSYHHNVFYVDMYVEVCMQLAAYNYM